MTAPAIGSVVPAYMTMMAPSSAADTTKFTQFGADGVGLIVGANRQGVTKIHSTHFVADQAAGLAVKQAASDQVGLTNLTIVRNDMLGSSQTIAGCTIVSVTVSKDNAMVGVGSLQWVVELDWEVILPLSY